MISEDSIILPTYVPTILLKIIYQGLVHFFLYLTTFYPSLLLEYRWLVGCHSRSVFYEKLVVDSIDCSSSGTLSVTTPIASSGGDVYSNSGGWDPLSLFISHFQSLLLRLRGLW